MGQKKLRMKLGCIHLHLKYDKHIIKQKLEIFKLNS